MFIYKFKYGLLNTKSINLCKEIILNNNIYILKYNLKTPFLVKIENIKILKLHLLNTILYLYLHNLYINKLF